MTIITRASRIARYLLFSFLWWAAADSAIAQPTWSVAIGNTHMEKGYEAQQTQLPEYNDGMVSIGNTYSYGAAFNASPPNVYVSFHDPVSLLQDGFAYDVQSWDKDYSVAELPEFDRVVWTTGVWNDNTGSYDIGIVSTTVSTATINWTQTFGGFGEDGGTSIIRLDGAYDSDLLVAGIMEAPTGDRDGFIARLDDATGAVVWAHRYGHADGHDALFDIQQDVLGQFGGGAAYAVGYTNTVSANGDDDVWLLCVDLGSGNINVSRTYGGFSNDRAFNLAQDNFDASIGPILTMIGETYSFASTNNDVLAIRTDGLGGITHPTGHWILAYEAGFGDAWDIGYDIAPSQRVQGNTVLAGQSNTDMFPEGNAIAFEIDPGGNLVFAHYYPQPEYETLRSLATNSLGGYYAVGTTFSGPPGGGDIYALALDSALRIGYDTVTTTDCHIPMTMQRVQGSGQDSLPAVKISEMTITSPAIDIARYNRLEIMCYTPPQVPTPFTNNAPTGLRRMQGSAPTPGITHLLLSPNPVRAGQDLMLTFTTELTGETRLFISDVLGRTVHTYEAADLASVRAITVSTKGWLTGTYAITLEYQGNIETSTVIVND